MENNLISLSPATGATSAATGAYLLGSAKLGALNVTARAVLASALDSLFFTFDLAEYEARASYTARYAPKHGQR